MTKPVILTVDDDVAVLSAIERDLRQQYRADYRVMKASSGAEALEVAKELAARNRQVALFLVDQRMPGMSGTEMLREVKQLHPGSRRVLLTAYADTDVAITGLNDNLLDHYLMKPWDPPDQRLYPVLNDLLAEWTARVRPAFEGVRVYGSQLSPQCYFTKEFLSRNQVEYQWVDVDVDASGRALAESLAGNLTRLPIVIFRDGTHLVAPIAAELAAKVGLQTEANEDDYEVIVIGSGPAGLATAVYAASEGLRTVIVESQAPGGQAGTSSMIENYLGFPAGVTGEDLAQRAMAQARKFGAELLRGQEVVALRRKDPERVVVLADGTELRTKCVVITTGMSARTLDVPGIAPLQGVCVFYGAAMTEAARYRGKDVCIVGGANSAGQGALYFSRHAKSVTMLVRRDLEATMSHYLIEKIGLAPNIDVITGVEVDSLVGEKSLESVVLKACDTGDRRNISASAMFIFIGVKPHADYFAATLERDDAGFIITGSDLPQEHGRPRGWPLERMPFMFETSIPGVFAAGDVRAGSNHRVAAAVGEGSATIHSVHRYLETV